MKRTVCLVIAAIVLFSCEQVLFEEDLSDRNVTIVAPVNNTVITTTSLNFNWNFVEDADLYQIQIATPTFANATQVLLDSTFNETAYTIELAANDYQWRIRALNENSTTPYTTASFSVQTETFNEDISQEIVTLVAPSDGATLETNPITFSWDEVQYAEDYMIQIATPDFDNAIQLVVDELVTGTSYEQTLDDGLYQWRIKARNSVSQTEYSINNLIVETESAFADRELVIISPPEGFISNLSIVNLQWLEVLDATLYRLQVIDPSDSTVISEQTTTDTSLIISFPEGSYIWQVRAENGNDYTEYTSQTITIDSILPNIPILLTPVDLEELTSTNVSFTWSREVIEGTAEKDSLFLYLDSDLTNLVLKEEVSGGSHTATLNNNQTYYWFMKAYDGAGNQSDDSDLFSFSIIQ